MIVGWVMLLESGLYINISLERIKCIKYVESTSKEQCTCEVGVGAGGQNTSLLPELMLLQFGLVWFSCPIFRTTN